MDPAVQWAPARLGGCPLVPVVPVVPVHLWFLEVASRPDRLLLSLHFSPRRRSSA